MITVDIVPIGKPRMTQRDKWAKRPAVVRYFEFRDRLQQAMRGCVPDDVSECSWVAYFPMPKSWPAKKKDAMRGKPHRQKPDRDNVDKAILDSLFSEDCGIYCGRIEKRWDDGHGPRIQLAFGQYGARIAM